MSLQIRTKRLWQSLALIILNLAYSRPMLANDGEGEVAKASSLQSAATEDEMAAILSDWEQENGNKRVNFPRKWLFLQEKAGEVGSPSPLNIDKLAFESFGWFELAESDAIRLYIQLNPSEKIDTLKAAALVTRLKRYALLSRAEGILLKSNDEKDSWSLYLFTKNMSSPTLTLATGPESFRGDAPASWLVAQLSYDAVVVGIKGDYLILAKLKPIRRGSQGLILKKSSSSIATDAEKEVGALLRVVHDSKDYVLAKVSLSKFGRPKVPVGSKVLFDQP